MRPRILQGGLEELNQELLPACGLQVAWEELSDAPQVLTEIVGTIDSPVATRITGRLFNDMQLLTYQALSDELSYAYSIGFPLAATAEFESMEEIICNILRWTALGGMGLLVSDEVVEIAQALSPAHFRTFLCDDGLFPGAPAAPVTPLFASNDIVMPSASAPILGEMHGSRFAPAPPFREVEVQQSRSPGISFPPIDGPRSPLGGIYLERELV